MADLPPCKAVFSSLLLEKRSNHFLDTNDKTDLRKQNHPRPTGTQPNKNGANSDKNQPQNASHLIEQTPTFPNMEQDIQFLKRQIDSL